MSESPEQPRGALSQALTWPLRHRPRLGATWLILLVAVFLIVVDNRAFWHAMISKDAVLSTANLDFGAAVVGLLLGLFTLVLCLGSSKYLLKFWLIAMLVIASAAAYFMDVYGVVIDASMLRNVVQTDVREASGLFNLRLVLHFALTAVLPALLIIWTRVRYHRFWTELGARILLAVLALVLAGGSVASQYKDFALVVRNHRALRYWINPTYPLYSAGKLVHADARAGNPPLKPLGRDATQARDGREKRAVFIIVVGETGRAANFGLDGYKRHTTPKLRAHKVINYPDFHSCGTSTAASVPCMFARVGRRDYDEATAGQTENLLDVLTHAGLQVFWRDNNSGCKGVCARVPFKDMTDANVPALCNARECYDEVLLHGLQKQLEATDKDTVVVLHLHGSHGPDYYRRHPPRFTRYTPECDSNAPQDCSRQAIINAYDNTVLYTDYVLGKTIDFLQAHSDRYDGGMIYIADHGESLGENGIYLHGFPYALAPKEQTHVQAVSWFSPGFARDLGLNIACLRARSGKRYSQDNLFSSVLGLLRVHTKVYQPKEDMFRPCQTRD